MKTKATGSIYPISAAKPRPLLAPVGVPFVAYSVIGTVLLATIGARLAREW